MHVPYSIEFLLLESMLLLACYITNFIRSNAFKYMGFCVFIKFITKLEFKRILFKFLFTKEFVPRFVQFLRFLITFEFNLRYNFSSAIISFFFLSCQAQVPGEYNGKTLIETYWNKWFEIVDKIEIFVGSKTQSIF